MKLSLMCSILKNLNETISEREINVHLSTNVSPPKRKKNSTPCKTRFHLIFKDVPFS